MIHARPRLFCPAYDVCVADAESGPGAQADRIAGLDTSVAHPARVYDYWLGGKDNFAADRVAAERVLAVAPGLRFRVRANRAFLGRATRYLADEAASASFSTSAPGFRPPTTRTRWRSGRPRAHGWSTSTTTRRSSQTTHKRYLEATCSELRRHATAPDRPRLGDRRPSL